MALKNYKSAQQTVGWGADERPKGDFYPSPPIAVDKLLTKVNLNGLIWEPACGNGAICEALKNHGYTNIIATDLYDWGYGQSDKNFLSEPVTDVDVVITNPPFNLSLEFAYRALEATEKKQGKVLMLNRLQWLEGKARGEMYKKTPFSQVLVFSGRLPRMHRFDYEGKKSSSLIAFAWYVWDWKHSGPPTIDWI